MLNLDPASHIKFPLPKCDKVIPYQHAFWNTVKGGSDTITKLIDFAEEKLGVRTPSTCSTARLMLLMAVAYQRVLQIMTASGDLEIYGTLRHFRKAASNRFTVFNTLDKIVDQFAEFSDGQSLVELRQNLKVLFQDQDQEADGLSSPQIRRSRRQVLVDVQSKDKRLPQVAHSMTPGRGKKKMVPEEKELAHQLRCQECISLVVVARLEEVEPGKPPQPMRRRCDWCKTSTNMFCMGCKRWLCVDKDHSDKKVTENGMKPPGALKFKQTKLNHKTREKKVETLYATKSCYHYAHEHVLDRVQGLRAEEPSFLTRHVDPLAAEQQSRLLHMQRNLKKDGL